MLIGLLVVFALLPLIVYGLRQAKTGTPSLQWPALAGIVKMEYQDKPPRMLGAWDGRRVAVGVHNNAVLITMQLTRPSRLRVEVGTKEEVARRAGIVVPDPVATGDGVFDARLLARCNDKAAGQAIFDPALRQRLLAQPVVEALGAADKVQWVLPELRDPDTLERVLEVMTAIASEMERFPG